MTTLQYVNLAMMILCGGSVISNLIGSWELIKKKLYFANAILLLCTMFPAVGFGLNLAAFLR